jgi:hypothetical protein
MTDSLVGPPTQVAAPRALHWLAEHADVGVRFIVAPPGFGKSTLLDAYVGHPERRCVRLNLDAATPPTDLTTIVARAVADAPLEIVLDDAHRANAQTLTTLRALVAAPQGAVRFIIASQRRDILDVGTLFARGRVAVCDQSVLALDAADARALFEARALDAAPDALARLVARCDGWPPAITGTIRELTRLPQPIDAAYEAWRRRWSVPAIDLVTTLLDGVPSAEGAAAHRHFAAGTTLDQQTLATLHRCGFFVRHDGGTFALMRWVDDLYAPAHPTRADEPLLDVTLFGRFRASLGGVPIAWARRRDAQIVKYLLLSADGSATRSELASVFWPHTARPLALQNLRTACSTMRRAIGNVVGMQRVDRYMIAGDRLVLNRSAIACDVERFRRHIAMADADDVAGARDAAIDHLRSAERLYGSGLFAGDVSEPMFAAHTAELAAAYARVLARLSDALIERGSPALAREYAAKALKLNRFPSHANGPQIHLRFAAS